MGRREILGGPTKIIADETGNFVCFEMNTRSNKLVVRSCVRARS